MTHRTPRSWNSTLPARRLKPRRTSDTPSPGEGAAILHPGPWRSEQIKKLAAKAPHCMRCEARNRGDVVGAHSNSLRDGKGMGLKAHDLVAYLCPACHDLVDERAGGWAREDREREFLRAVYRTVLWLLQEGYLKVIGRAA